MLLLASTTSGYNVPVRAHVRMQMGTITGAATAAAAVIEETSRAVASKGIEAPDAGRSFVSMDADRAGLVDDEGLPLIYDKDAIQKYWSTQGGALQQRWAEFLGVTVPFITRVAGLLISGGTDALEENSADLARDARVNLEKLGPTYIKMGQMLSVRPDVLPQAALDELAALQDGVKGFEQSIAIAMVEQELGRPLMEVFEEFSEEPVAAASLAQVYRAKLRGSGEVVAVKVQRPGVQSLVSKDLYVLRRAAEVYQGLISRFAPQQRTDYVALLNEFAVGFYTELDFVNEAANMKKMARLFAEQGVTDVAVPIVYDELTSRRLLVSEWVDGVKLSECAPEEVQRLTKIGQECFLVQLLQVGFFHSDPHPGNLLRPHDQSKAQLYLIDFGLVAQVRQQDMDAIVSAIIHLANKDYEALVDDFIDLEILPADCNRPKVVPLMDKALSPYVKGGGAKKYEEELKQMYGMDGTAEGAVGGFQAMTQDMLTVLNDIPFSIPPYFALLARAVVTLEGIALTADPEYGLILEAYPFVARKLLSEDRPELQRALQEVLYSKDATGSVTPTRLASLLNSAAGIVAKQDGAVFVDLDAVPEDGISTDAALRFVLSSEAASLRTLLADEALTAADLLLRQAVRKSAPALANSLPQLPRLPLLPPPPEPLTTPLPFVLPDGSGGVRAAVVSPQQLVDALAPKLTREEELYALSLTDLVKSTLGEEAAAVANGDLVTNPLAALRTLLDAVAATPDAASTPLPAQAPQIARSLAAQLPRTAAAGGDAAAAGGGGSSIGELGEVVATLGTAEQQELDAQVSRLTEALRARLEERLATVA